MSNKTSFRSKTVEVKKFCFYRFLFLKKQKLQRIRSALKYTTHLYKSACADFRYTPTRLIYVLSQSLCSLHERGFILY